MKEASDPSYKTEKNSRLIGAIDIGTNSTHLVVASIDVELQTFSIDLTEKSSTRLGERDPDTGELTDIAMQRVVDTLIRFKAHAGSYKVEQLILAATSAVREAPNGQDLIKRIKEELDLSVELISGAEEARLIYLGVLSGMQFGEQPHFLVDIGGGSTELILGDSSDARALTSTRVGAVRLQHELIKVEPMPKKRYEFVKTFIKGSLEPATDKILQRVKPGEVPAMIATSGTAMAVGSLVAQNEGKLYSNLHGFKVSKNSLDQVIANIIRMTPSERRGLSAISEKRSEIIVPGALILQATMEMLGINELFLSERALREGLVVDWMSRNGLLEDRLGLQSSIRQRTIIHQAHRFAVNQKRSERVANIALNLYDHTLGLLHGDKGLGRELLWAASMLHACGQHINISSYHKHSWYLIRNGELLGYSQAEHLMVAAIARYHRKSLPKKRHEAWQSIASKAHRKIVLEMSLILRLASALDKRPESVVESIIVSSNDSELTIELVPEKAGQNLSLEEWSLSECGSIVKECAGVTLRVATLG